jgi:hypothetical protein
VCEAHSTYINNGSSAITIVINFRKFSEKMERELVELGEEDGK